MSIKQASLNSIFSKSIFVLFLSFLLIFAVAIFNIIQFKSAIYHVTEIEQKILFPLSRAVEEMYRALIELKEQSFQQDSGKITSEYLNVQISNAYANLEMGLKAISEETPNHIEMLIPIKETLTLARKFEVIGTDTINSRKEALTMKREMAEEINSTINKIDGIQTDLSHEILTLEINNRERGYLVQALNDLTGVKNRLIQFDRCISARAHVIMAGGTSLDRCSQELEDIDFLLDNVLLAVLDMPQRLDSLSRAMKKINKIQRSFLDKTQDTQLLAAKAEILTEELAANLELCRQSVATVNQSVNGQVRQLKNHMFIFLGIAVVLAVYLGMLFIRWTRSNILSPIIELSRSITAIGRGHMDLRMRDSGIEELSLLFREVGVMASRLKLRENKLTEARKQWEAIFKAIGGPAFVLGSDLTIEECNHAFLEMVGAVSVKEVRGRKCTDVITSLGSEPGLCPLDGAGIRQMTRPIGFEKKIKGKPYYFTVSPCLDNGESVEKVIVVGSDLSELRDLEARLQRAQKMEALGTLAGGVAHDLNNILTGLVSYPDLLIMQLEPDSPLRQSLGTIKNAGARAAAVVQDLLTLARRTITVKKVINLNRLVEEYLASPEFMELKGAAPDVSVRTVLADNLLNIEGSPVHLIKMIMNLVTNAFEASSVRGTITITTENVFLDHPVAGYDSIIEGEYIKIAVDDDGSGISSEDLPHIFEPFYTKKVMGRSGSGLGMAVVWGTVKDHNGYIDVKSAKGSGTTFIIYLPVSRKMETKAIEAANLQRAQDGECILIVDDLEQQRSMATDILSSLGYTVSAVKSGEEAVERCKSERFHLVVLDMIMDPGIDGLETYRRLSEICPGQKAIITSGYSETDHVRKALELGVGLFVKKPYSIAEIAGAIREVLDS